jgi:FKBP-type peptidyl-prolyl cis-trans isomerase
MISRRLALVWCLCGALWGGLAGCLPPVEEATDSIPAAQTGEQAAQHAEAQTTPPPPAEPGEFQTTASGLKYKIVRPGGEQKPKPSDTVKCHYKGWLDDGTVFDSSYDRGEPAEFSLGGVIAGWTEGLQLIGEGGEIELEIPSHLGYGEAGRPPKIPGGATLHFKVELLEIL